MSLASPAAVTRRWRLRASCALLLAGACGGPQEPGKLGATCFRDDDCKAGLICVAPTGETDRVCSDDPTPLISNVEGPPVVETGGAAAIGGAAAGGGMAPVAGTGAVAGTGTVAGSSSAGSSSAGSEAGGSSPTGGTAGSGAVAGTGGSDAGGTDTAGTGGTGGTDPVGGAPL